MCFAPMICKFFLSNLFLAKIESSCNALDSPVDLPITGHVSKSRFGCCADPMLAGLPPWQIDVVADAVEPIVVGKGQAVAGDGTDDGYTYFLIEGKVALEPADGNTMTIDLSGDHARYAGGEPASTHPDPSRR